MDGVNSVILSYINYQVRTVGLGRPTEQHAEKERYRDREAERERENRVLLR